MGDILIKADENADWVASYTFNLVVTAFAGVFKDPYVVEYPTPIIVIVDRNDPDANDLDPPNPTSVYSFD